MIKLTDQEKQIIKEMNDYLYTAEFLETWINKDCNDNYEILQAREAHGYYRAVHHIATIMEKQ